MEQEKINKIIESLEYVLKRPKMYFGKDDDADLAASYLYGIRLAVFALINFNKTIISAWHEAIIKRGHWLSPRAVSKELKEEGYENNQIVIEVIEIEIETWKIFRDSLEK